MSKCALCKKEMQNSENPILYSTFGLLPSSSKVCSSCREELNFLYNDASKMPKKDYVAECNRFKAKHNNAAADAVIEELNRMNAATPKQRTPASPEELADTIHFFATIFLILGLVVFVIADMTSYVTEYNVVNGRVVATLSNATLIDISLTVASISFILRLLTKKKKK